MKKSAFFASASLFTLTQLLFSLESHADLVKGSYTVPASSDGVVSAETYTSVVVSLVKDADGLLNVSFFLPEDLTGSLTPPVVMSQVQTENPHAEQLSGAGVSAYCTQNAATSQTDCKMAYFPGYLKADSATLSDYLKHKYSGQTQTLSKKLVQGLHFIKEPEGTLSFKL